jgi:hypothetical protein
MKTKYFYSLTLLFLALTIVVSCGKKEKSNTASEEKSETVLTIEAEDYTDANETFEIKELTSTEKVVIAPAEGWIALDVDVKVAGRYKTEIEVSSLNGAPVTCWVEDYVDNTDDRTYNITGNMEVSSTNLVTISVDGSPLNVGVHKMKVHFNGAVSINWIKFSLIKPHDITPTTLTQKIDGKEWKVVWSDEFDGTELDTLKWTYDIGNWGW